MEYPRVKARSKKDESPAGVYADLDDLIRLQFKARGFSFLPKQPLHSLLTGRHASRLRGQGVALYREGQFEAAAAAFGRIETAEAWLDRFVFSGDTATLGCFAIQVRDAELADHLIKLSSILFRSDARMGGVPWSGKDFYKLVARGRRCISTRRLRQTGMAASFSLKSNATHVNHAFGSGVGSVPDPVSQVHVARNFCSRWGPPTVASGR